MNTKIVLATLIAAVAFFPLTTTPSHAATCAEELKLMQDKFVNAPDPEDKRGAEYSIAEAKKALAQGDEAKCKTQIEEAERQLSTRKPSGGDK